MKKLHPFVTGAFLLLSIASCNGKAKEAEAECTAMRPPYSSHAPTKAADRCIEHYPKAYLCCSALANMCGSPTADIRSDCKTACTSVKNASAMMGAHNTSGGYDPVNLEKTICN